jgi:flavin reductase (DIM6/NTAB) family NADH-FMN oxidoreductase RutF
MTIDTRPDLFRTLLRRHAAGVVVVTAAGERPVGFTATSFTSVSLAPPLVSFCLNRESSSWPTISRARHVAVHLLGAGQEHLARTFAERGVDRFAPPTRWHTGRHGTPILTQAPTLLVCQIVDRILAGDHAIVLAELVEGSHIDEANEPLLYHMGRYRQTAA